MADITIEDLMRMTYQGNYAAAVLGKLPMKDCKIGKEMQSLPGDQLGNYLFEELKKADDPFYTSKTNYFNPIYGAAVFNWLNLEADLWKLLRKTTYAQLGDSYRSVEAEASNFYGQLEAGSALGDTDIPTLREINITDPSIMYNHWNSSLLAQLKSTWQDSPSKSGELFLREYFARQHPSNINAKLGESTDIPAAPGGAFDNYIESIDRVCSDGAESALLTLPADNDIYGLDRSANEGEAYVDLNGGVLRDLDAGLLDDMITSCKLYSTKRNFIIITDEAQINTLEGLESIKYRYGADNKYKLSTINGVNTRNGVQAGFSIATYRGSGVEVPLFTSKDIFATGGGSGNIYLLDMDRIDIRVALPTVYLNTGNLQFLTLDSMQYKYMYMTVAQLAAQQFNCHGAIKYLN